MYNNYCTCTCRWTLSFWPSSTNISLSLGSLRVFILIQELNVVEGVVWFMRLTFCWVFQASSHLFYPYPAQCLIGLRTISCIIHANKKPYRFAKLKQCAYNTCIVLLLMHGHCENVVFRSSTCRSCQNCQIKVFQAFGIYAMTLCITTQLLA